MQQLSKKLQEPLEVMTVSIHDASETIRCRTTLGEALGLLIKNPTKRVDHLFNFEMRVNDEYVYFKPNDIMHLVPSEENRLNRLELHKIDLIGKKISGALS